jgi:hypothetical protein
MSFASAMASGTTAGTAISVMNIVGAAVQAGAPLAMWGTHSQSDHWTWEDGNVYDGFGSTVRKTCGSLSNRNDARVVAQVSAASLWTIWLNGTQFFTTASNTVGWGVSPKLGLSNFPSNFYWNGNLGAVAFLPSQASAALRKRLEHAAAYSFKISCN